MSISQLSVKVGCCGFPKRKSFYFEKFSLVELQSCFYQPPLKEDTPLRWKNEAPAGFEFTLKAWQIITHFKNSFTYHRLKKDLGKRDNYGFFQPTYEVFKAYNTMFKLAKNLGAKIIVFQTPPNFKEIRENISNIYNFFNKIKREDLIFCWEQRGGWSSATIKKICKELNIIHCVDPFKEEPLEGEIFYFRLQGRKGYNYQYSDRDLEELKEKVKLKPAYVLFNNVYMWNDGLRFKRILEG